MKRRTIADADFVCYRLEEAGRTLMALPAHLRPDLGLIGLDVSRLALVNGGIATAAPSAEQRARMGEALTWLYLIPAHQMVLRKIALCRALVGPATGRPVFTWAALAGQLGVDYKTTQLWHARAVAQIVAKLSSDQREVAA